MFGAILKATKSSFQKGMTFCRSIYVKRVMKLFAFIFEQPSYHCWLCHIYPHAFFLKKQRGYCIRLRPSVCPSVCACVRLSVMLSPPKPLDEIQPNLVSELLT